MYFKDGSTYSYIEKYSSSNIINIGWLAAGHEFTTGTVSDKFLAKLWQFCQFPLVKQRGYHVCELCESAPDDVTTLVYLGQTARLGFAEIRILAEHKQFAAPNLIMHYILEHQYCPPQEFIEAVLQSPEAGSEEYLTALEIHAPALLRKNRVRTQ